MPRSPSTYSLPPGTTPQVPNTVISSSMFTAFADDVAQTFNTIQPIVYGGTGSNDLKLTDTDFGIKDNGDPTKIGQFNASNLPTATTRTYDLPYYSGTLGLVSDIRGQIFGLTLSNTPADLVNDITVAAGSAVDETGAVSMLLASGLTKQLDAVWAVGNNAGMRASGAAIANTTYHIFLIRRPDTGVVDIAADTSATGANIAANTNANYTQLRRIGSIIRLGGTILGFLQDGDQFILWSPIQITATNPGTLGAAYTLTVPVGIKVIAIVNGGGSNGSNNWFGLLTSLDGSDPAPGGGVANIQSVYTGGTTLQVLNRVELRTNTSGQIRGRISASGVSDVLIITTLGWKDGRGAY